MHRTPLDGPAKLECTVQNYTAHGRKLVPSEQNQQVAELGLQHLNYWEDQIQNILKNSLFIKMSQEIKMLPGKPGKYENEQIHSERKTIRLKFKTQWTGSTAD